jgi:tetratricopeptide (TPR) repeat protein
LPYSGYYGGYYYYREPYTYVSYHVPAYSYVPVTQYQRYVYLDTPTVKYPSREIQAAPYGAKESQAMRRAADETFESPLALILSGRGEAGVAFALGEAKLRDGEFGQAAAAFSQSLKDYPDDAAARVALALALMGDGKYEGAAHMLKRGLRLLPDWQDIRLGTEGPLSGSEAYEEAMLRLRDAAAEQPADTDLQLLLGFHYYSSGRFAEAAKILWAAQEAGATEELIRDLLLAAEERLALGAPEGGGEGERQED